MKYFLLSFPSSPPPSSPEAYFGGSKTITSVGGWYLGAVSIHHLVKPKSKANFHSCSSGVISLGSSSCCSPCVFPQTTEMTGCLHILVPHGSGKNLLRRQEEELEVLRAAMAGTVQIFTKCDFCRCYELQFLFHWVLCTARWWQKLEFPFFVIQRCRGSTCRTASKPGGSSSNSAELSKLPKWFGNLIHIKLYGNWTSKFPRWLCKTQL